MPSVRLYARCGPLVCLAALLVLAGCGRRGPLEPPAGAAVEPTRAAPTDTRLRPAANRTPSRSATASRLATEPAAGVIDTPEDEENEESAENTALAVTPTPTPRRRIREFTVPKEPFVLDPLL